MIYDLKDQYYVRSLLESDLDGPYPTWFEDQDVCQYNSQGKLIKNKNYFKDGGFKHEVQHGITIDETPLQAF
jgi:hypothetical protein